MRIKLKMSSSNETSVPHTDSEQSNREVILEGECRSVSEESDLKEPPLTKPTGTCVSEIDNITASDLADHEKSNDDATVLDKSQSEKNNRKTGYSSKWSKYRAVKKVKNVLPKTPEKRVQIVEKLIESPTCKQHLTKSDIILTPEMKQKVKIADSLLSTMKDLAVETKEKKSAKSNPGGTFGRRILKTVIHESSKRGKGFRSIFEKKLGLKNTWRQEGKSCWTLKYGKQRRDVLSHKLKTEVKQFYTSGEVSKCLPSKKDVSKKTNEAKFIMTSSIKDAYLSFRKKYPDRKIGFISFYKLKPKNVKKVSETNRRCCLCQVCCNVALKLDAANAFITGKATSIKNMSKREVADLTVCNYNGMYPDSKCLSQECEKCGVGQLKEYYQELLPEYGETEIVYYRWETVVVPGKDGKTKRCVSCVQKKTGFTAFLDDFEKDLKPLPGHLFRASWQLAQLEKCKETITENEAVVIMDFAENYSCRYQNEVQSAFWDSNQVSIHPMMAYYMVKTDNNLIRRKHAVIGITNDQKHDADAVQQFRKILYQKLNDEVENLSVVHEWTDGCASQYKGRKSFADVSNDQKLVQRHFFETSHGKNVCDGIGATVKNTCHQAVISGKRVISNSEELYSFCKDKLTVNTIESKREFIFVDTDTMSRDRPDVDVGTLVGTRKLHSVKNCGEKLKIHVRELSCFCNECRQNDGLCENRSYIKPWECKLLKRNKDADKACREQNQKVDSKKNEASSQRKKKPGKKHEAQHSKVDLKSQGDCINTRQNMTNVSAKTKENKDKETLSVKHICMERDYQKLVCKFKLQDFYPGKISIMLAMTITKETKHVNIEHVPWIILRKIIITDFRARDEHLFHFLKSSLASEQDKGKTTKSKKSALVNPLDFFLTLFSCCDNYMKQVITDKLSICRLCFPLIYASDREHGLYFPLSCLRGLNLEWDSKGEKLKHFSPIDCSMKILSFVRLNRPAASKSKYANLILSNESHDTFFNCECLSGKTKRVLANGMIEASWFLPSGKKDQIFPNLMLFLNLRGNANTYNEQLEILLETSSMFIVFLDSNSKSLCDKSLTNLIKINKSGVSVLHVLVERKQVEEKDNETDDEDEEEEKDENKDNGEEEETIEKIITKNSRRKDKKFIYITDRSVVAEIRNEIRDGIEELLINSRDSSLSILRDKSRKFDVKCDEDDESSKHGKDLAEKNISTLANAPIQTLKHKHLPSQESKWMEYTNLLKQKHKCSESMNEKSKILSQISEVLKLLSIQGERPTALIESFIGILLKYLDKPKILSHFIYWLSLLLDEKSKRELPDLRQLSHNAWRQMKIAEENQKHSDLERLKNEALKAERLLSDASFGYEHIVRELGHMYESLKLCKCNVKPENREKIFQLSEVLAKLLVSGHCFELMDGDTASVPMNWIRDVITHTSKIIGDVHVVSLSILGIQSSGKSTLLNTMFGLRFSVSAGRCTRGIFMQLIPINISNLNAKYVLVIDTKGLRAPELADQKYNHDNELATFVIGLSDITIVNIKGENNAEVKDVLQIVIHAFLRLRATNHNLKLNKSCVFIHQNVSSVNAKEKLMQGKQTLVNLLNTMAKDAAHQENNAEVTAFKQVINFDDDEHIWYFSDLWKGDPPMAPANTGYSQMAEEVKQMIFQTIAPSRQPFFKLLDWVGHVEDLWNGILGENFVFAFRNSLEVKAYNSMEVTYMKCRWSLEDCVTEWIQEQSTQSQKCEDGASLETFVFNATKIIVGNINKKTAEIKAEIDDYFEKDSLKEISAKWKQSKLHQLELKSAELISTAINEIKRMAAKQATCVNIKVKQSKHRFEINAKAEKLADEFHGKVPEEYELKSLFDRMWNIWVKELIQDEPVNISHTVEQEIYLALELNFQPEFVILQKCLKSVSLNSKLNLPKLAGSWDKEDIKDNFISVKHYGLKKRLHNRVTDYKILALNIIDTMFKKIDVYLSNLRTRDTEFHPAFVNKILDIIIQGIDDHNQQIDTEKYKITATCKINLVVYSCRHCLPIFNELNVSYESKHGTKAQLEKYKDTAWKHFKNIVHKASNEVIVASLFIDCLTEPVLDAVSKQIPGQIASKISNEKFSFSKWHLIIELLKGLASNEDFHEFNSYISDSYTYALEYISDYTNQVLFMFSGEDESSSSSQYASWAIAVLNPIISDLEQAIHYASKKSNSKTVFRYWVNDLTKQLKILVIPAKTFDHLSEMHISDFSSFENKVQKYLQGIKDDIVKKVRATNSSNVKWENLSPGEMVMNKLWGAKRNVHFVMSLAPKLTNPIFLPANHTHVPSIGQVELKVLIGIYRISLSSSRVILKFNPMIRLVAMFADINVESLESAL